MLSDEERQYLFWLGSSEWTGVGDVVEIGPWLGGSTISLAAGMRANKRLSGEKRFHVFDNFVWVDYMARRALLPIRTGESFEPFFLENLKDYRDLLVSYCMELPDEVLPSDPETMQPVAVATGLPLVDWPSNKAVEILFVDGAKSWSAFRHLLITFAPVLAPGSLLVCQDYKCWGNYWITALTQGLSANLEVLHVLHENTVALRVKLRIAPELVLRLRDVSLDEGIALVRAAGQNLADLGDRLGAAIVATGLVNFVVDKSGDLAEARRFYDEVVAAWPLGGNTHNLKRLRAWLEAHLGQSLPQDPRERTLAIHERLRARIDWLVGIPPRAVRKTLRVLQRE